MSNRKDKIAELFSGIEIEKRKEIFALMQDWEKTISRSKIVFKDNNEEYRGKDFFNYYGFFPGYYGTNPKVLFIAREARHIAGSDYVGEAIDFFKETPTLNNDPFWKRILCMYNIIMNKGIIDKNITADEIVEKMIKENNYGFAVTNISKYSNLSVTGAERDKVLMNKFFEDSKFDQRNFIKEEIEILDPDLIITANIWEGNMQYKEYMEEYFGKREIIKEIWVKSNCVAVLCNYKFGSKEIKLIDPYHFSNPCSDMDCFYKPISKFIKMINKTNGTAQ